MKQMNKASPCTKADALTKYPPQKNRELEPLKRANTAPDIWKHP